MSVVSLEIQGNSEQETREGYNMLNVVRASDARKGIEFTNNGDGSFTLNGTCSEDGLYIDLNNSTGNRFTLTQGKKYLLYLKGIQQGVNLNVRTLEEVYSITLNGTDGKDSTIKTWVDETSDNGFAYIAISKGTVINNKTFYPMLAESDVELEYEAYGAMPSPEYPSEIETVNTQANIIIENSDKTEQQTKTVDIQQEMLEGDYFVKEEDGWKEVQTWGKIILNGAESGWNISGTDTSGINRFSNNIISNLVKKVLSSSEVGLLICDKFIVISANQSYNKIEGICINSSGTLYIFYNYCSSMTVKEFKNWLSQNNLTLYYKLETPLKLVCTEKQVQQLEDLLNTSTYKNVTHIYSTDKVSPVIKIKYRKDIETMFNTQQSNYDTRLSNIEKLLSTTTTSALLLDNLQSDLEKEVL